MCARGSPTDPFTAEQAAKCGTSTADAVCVIPAGGASGFLAPLSVSVLDASSLGAGPAASASDDLVGLLARLGMQTLGDFAAMMPDRVRERFGERGIRLHALAGGARLAGPSIRARHRPSCTARSRSSRRSRSPTRSRSACGSPPTTSSRVLGAVDLVCTELRVELVGDRGERSERVWLHPRLLRRGLPWSTGCVGSWPRPPRDCAAVSPLVAHLARGRRRPHPTTPRPSSVADPKRRFTTPCRACRRCSGIVAC
jgi:hypothetical protein